MKEDGDEASSSRCSRKSVAMFATMMRKAFKDDDLILGKLSMQHIMFILCLILKAYDYYKYMVLSNFNIVFCRLCS